MSEHPFDTSDPEVAAALKKYAEQVKAERAKWPKGPWDAEPDRAEWKSDVGYPCLAIRGAMGCWCGYVGVPPTHPAYGKSYDVVNVEVHGGLTYANKCRGYICQVSALGDPDDVFWFLGFDCAHAFDESPGMVAFRNEYMPESMRLRAEAPGDFCDVYRTLDYVKAECASLAAQLWAMRDGPLIEDKLDDE